MNFAEIIEKSKKWRQEVEEGRKRQQEEATTPEIKKTRQGYNVLVFKNEKARKEFYKKRQEKTKETRLKNILKKWNLKEPAPKNDNWSEKEKKIVEHYYLTKKAKKEEILIITGFNKVKVSSHITTLKRQKDKQLDFKV